MLQQSLETAFRQFKLSLFGTNHPSHLYEHQHIHMNKLGTF